MSKKSGKQSLKNKRKKRWAEEPAITEPEFGMILKKVGRKLKTFESGPKKNGIIYLKE